MATNSTESKTSLSRKPVNSCSQLSSPATDRKSRITFNLDTSKANSAPNGKLKSSLSKSSLKQQTKQFDYESHQSIQQIVKQKRENCLQVRWIRMNFNSAAL